MYPIIVILLISMQRPVESTLRWQITTKTSRITGGTPISPTVPQHAAARSIPLDLGSESESEQDLDVDMEAAAEPFPTSLGIHSYAESVAFRTT